MSKAIIDVDTYLYKAAVGTSTLVEIQEGIYYECYDIESHEHVPERYPEKHPEKRNDKEQPDSSRNRQYKDRIRYR